MAPATLGYLAFINRMGESDLITQGLNSTQPTLGSLFKSQIIALGHQVNMRILSLNLTKLNLLQILHQVSYFIIVNCL